MRGRASRCQRDMTLDVVGKECIKVSTTASKVWRDRTRERRTRCEPNGNINDPRQARTTLVLERNQSSPFLVLLPVLSRSFYDRRAGPEV